ncbi:MAG: TolC family protein [Bacteroidales bacterium]|nr:TolC family protein [Bacteroidales bacterium]MBN2817846.1 TolC family protein [Bacteroidales bacterium]
MLHRKVNLLVVLLFLILKTTTAQQVYELDLVKSIEIAKKQSHNMLMLQQNLKVAEYRLVAATNKFKTNVEMNLTAPNYTETINDYSDTTGIHYYPVQNFSYSGNLVVNQPLPTDGNVYITSGIRNLDDYYNENKSLRFNTRMGLSQPIEAFYAYNSIKAEYEKAELNYELSFKSLKRAELDLVYDISRIFYSLLSTSERMEIAHQDRIRQEDAYQTAKSKYDAGLIRETEALQMEIDLGAAQNDYDIAMVDYESQANLFKQQIGIALHDSVIISGKYDYKEVYVDVEKAVQLGLENRLEIREHEIEIALSEIEIDRQKSNGMVNGEITAYYDLIGVGYNPINTPMSNAFNEAWLDLNDRPGNKGVALNINIPIIDWGVNKSLVKAAIASQEREKYSLDLEKITIEREIRNTVNQLHSSLRRLQLLEKNVKVAERNFEISKARFTNGDIDAQTLALDRTRLNNAYVTHLNAYISYKLLIADLSRKTFYDFENDTPYSYETD